MLTISQPNAELLFENNLFESVRMIDLTQTQAILTVETSCKEVLVRNNTFDNMVIDALIALTGGSYVSHISIFILSGVGGSDRFLCV